MEILLFVFFVLVLIGMLVGGRVVKSVKKFKEAAQQAADKKEQQFRDEVGRQRQQYSQRPQSQSATTSAHTTHDAHDTQTAHDAHDTHSAPEPEQNDNARRTQTATGETIIDHHHEKRENRKIFDDSDGEYTDFVEVKNEE
ncbi:MAG: DUF4834 family protein [Prevotella sp.]|nr:DUF4834 family protein [Prevotella sp.]